MSRRPCHTEDGLGKEQGVGSQARPPRHAACARRPIVAPPFCAPAGNGHQPCAPGTPGSETWRRRPRGRERGCSSPASVPVPQGRPRCRRRPGAGHSSPSRGPRPARLAGGGRPRPPASNTPNPIGMVPAAALPSWPGAGRTPAGCVPGPSRAVSAPPRLTAVACLSADGCDVLISASPTGDLVAAPVPEAHAAGALVGRDESMEAAAGAADSLGLDVRPFLSDDVLDVSDWVGNIGRGRAGGRRRGPHELARGARRRAGASFGWPPQRRAHPPRAPATPTPRLLCPAWAPLSCTSRRPPLATAAARPPGQRAYRAAGRGRPWPTCGRTLEGAPWCERLLKLWWPTSKGGRAFSPGVGVGRASRLGAGTTFCAAAPARAVRRAAHPQAANPLPAFQE